jgi:hypothetical protein
VSDSGPHPADDLANHLGQHVTVTGVARNGSAGALVSRDDEMAAEPVYVAGLRSWGELAGRKVSVSGLLHRRAIIPLAVVDDDGAVSHGLGSAPFVIDEAVWTG